MNHYQSYDKIANVVSFCRHKTVAPKCDINVVALQSCIQALSHSVATTFTGFKAVTITLKLYR